MSGHNRAVTLARKLTIALVVIAIGWLLVLVVWGPAPFAASFDDAYYYFTIGRNWAQGHASTFNQLDQTNGYHPLWQAISILPFLVGLDGYAAVRSLLVVQLGLWCVAMLLVIRMVAKSIDGWPRLQDHMQAKRWCDALVVAAFVVLAANPFAFKMTVNGLESGLVVPVGAWLIWFATTFKGRFVTQATPRDRWVIGGLLGLAFLSRTDAIILVGVIAVWCLMDRDATTLSVNRRALRMAQLLAIPAAVIVGYLIMNQAVFGTPMQISGTIKRLPLTPVRVALIVVWAALGLAALWGCAKPIRKSSRLLHTRRFLSANGWYLAFCIGLVGYYTTLQEVPYLWYFAPLALLGTFLVLFVIADLSQGAVLEATAKTKGPVTRMAVVPAMILLVPLAAALIWAIPNYVAPGTRALLEHDAYAGTWMHHNLPPDARVASWDAGAIGYFSHRRIVNLDGVVNNLDFYHAGKEGRIPQFLAQRDVRWLANHGGDLHGRDPDIDRQIRAYFGPANVRRIAVVYRATYDYSGSLDGSRSDISTKRMGTYVYRIDQT